MRSDFSLGYLAARACPAAVVSIAIGIIAGIVRLDSIPDGGDFSWHLRAARNLIAGAEIYSDSIASDPYYYVPYPLPAAFLALPFAWLRNNLAAAAFVGASAAIIVWCLIRAGLTRIFRIDDPAGQRIENVDHRAVGCRKVWRLGQISIDQAGLLKVHYVMDDVAVPPSGSLDQNRNEISRIRKSYSPRKQRQDSTNCMSSEL